MNVALNEFQTNLVPFPRLFVAFGIEFLHLNLFCSCFDPEEDIFMAISLNCRMYRIKRSKYNCTMVKK